MIMMMMMLMMLMIMMIMMMVGNSSGSTEFDWTFVLCNRISKVAHAASSVPQPVCIIQVA